MGKGERTARHGYGTSAGARVRYLETPALTIPATVSRSHDLSYEDTELHGESACTDAERPAATPYFGRRIGPYQLIEELGEGGMGVVYRALRADDHYLKSVAIKLMKGDFTSNFSVMRFRVERQILASLEHPNIARFWMEERPRKVLLTW